MEQNEVVKETVELTLEQKLNEKRKAYRNGDILYKAISIAVIALSMAYAVGLFMGFLAEWDVVRYIIGIVLLLGMFFSIFILPRILKLSKKYKEYSLEYKTVFLKPVF
ncbi:MAG: hypothetical protein IKY53_02380 [Lachnospiraceae bacterium]|nr:hypothetical protein [Lachnospiraceae bacterium]